MAKQATQATLKWNDKALLREVETAAGKAIHLAAEAGARATRGAAPGSIKPNTTVSEKRKESRATLIVNIRSRMEGEEKYHSAYPEWGTARQPGQHFGLKGLKAARQTLDREADGMLE